MSDLSGSDPFKPERDAIEQYRKARDPDATNDAPLVGLALSGGGIRSAVFCLGLLRALAKKNLLVKFDYISTVSGGGYVGAMLGRLYQSGTGANKVQDALAKDDSILLAWLRNNGRYLTPAGMRDISLSISQILRSFFAALFLVTLICGFIGGLAVWLNPLFYPDLRSFGYLFVLPLSFAAWFAFSYWVFKKQTRYLIITILFFLMLVIVCGMILPFPWLYTAVISSICLVPNLFIFRAGTDNVSSLRLSLTKALTIQLIILVLLVFLLGINRTGWKMYHEFLADDRSLIRVASFPAIVAALRICWEIRPIKGLVQKISSRFTLGKISIIAAANLSGIILILFCLVSVCASIFKLAETIPTNSTPIFISIFSMLLFIILCLSSRIKDFLNLSSLHNLYRARLERVWISVANYMQPGKSNYRFRKNPILSAVKGDMSQIKKVTSVIPGDDVLLKYYTPHVFGGPIHLMTCCINQTIDDRSDSYNADRKGIAFTVGPFGSETGTYEPTSCHSLNNLSLSSLVAISGAAAATGMGSRTSPGLAFLLFLLGGRLGYWMKNPVHGATAQEHSWPGSALAQTVCLFAEMFARFPGKNSKYWYLSDGGHFENTGVYPLLKRRVKTIVVADCGADPKFNFDDLENLVRKARIDYGISIFLSSAITGKRTSMAQLQKGGICPPLITARIYYPKAANHKPMIGKLIIVKPHILKDIGLDTASYAERHPDFPQQTTGDQFFDEEQWEAYHQLGLQAGKAITAAMLK